MPKINSTAPALINNALTFRERLMDRFAAHEYVRVLNIDNEPVKWQYLPSTAEEHTFTADPMKITHRGDVEVYLLNPGESEVLLGENAYIMIELLYKQVVAKTAVAHNPDMPDGRARNFNFSDPIKQEEYIDKIYLGKETPNFGSYEQVSQPEPKATKAKNVGSKTERDLRKHLSEQVA